MTIRRTHELGYVIDCKGAWLRPHAKATAIRLIVSGQVNAHNCALIQANFHRFLKLGEPLILDLEGALFAQDEARVLLGGFSAECAHHSIPSAAVLDHRTGGSLGHRAAADTPVFHRVADAVAHLTGSTSAAEQEARFVTRGPRENSSRRGTFSGPPRPVVDSAAVSRRDRADRIRKLTIC